MRSCVFCDSKGNCHEHFQWYTIYVSFFLCGYNYLNMVDSVCWVATRSLKLSCYRFANLFARKILRMLSIWIYPNIFIMWCFPGQGKHTFKQMPSSICSVVWTPYRHGLGDGFSRVTTWGSQLEGIWMRHNTYACNRWVKIPDSDLVSSCHWCLVGLSAFVSTMVCTTSATLMPQQLTDASARFIEITSDTYYGGKKWRLVTIIINVITSHEC